jgi:Transposase protein
MFGVDSNPQNPEADGCADLTPEPDLNLTVVNERVVIRDQAEIRWRMVLVSGVPLASYSWGDKVTQRLACASLRLLALATQEEVCAAFGHRRASQARWEKLYRERGLKGLSLQEPPGRRCTIPASIEDAVEKLHGEGLGLRRIGAAVGLSRHQVAGIYRRRGIAVHGSERQEELFAEPAEAADGGTDGLGEVTGDAAGGDTAEEALGSEEWSDGLLVPAPESGERVSWAGGLLAVPVLWRLKVVDTFLRVYKGFGPVSVYGLELIVTLMVLLALWRIKRPEQLKTVAPTEIGRALGLPRTPEVKTVRRKLRLLAKQELAREVMLELGKVRLEQQESLVGYLYLDGHVREYSGKEDVAKGFSMRRHRPVRAATDTWAADRNGDPLLVVTSQVNEHLTQVLEPVLAEVRDLVGPEERVTVIFDRGGWSPQLFARLIDDRFDIITYRKGYSRDVPVKRFVEVKHKVDGKEVTYRLHDRKDVRVGAEQVVWKDGTPGPLMMRQVTRLNADTARQTKVLTTRRDIKPEEVLWRMFARWRQENYFKYMLEEMAIDGLVEYGAEPVDPGLDRPNPERLALEKEIDKLKARIMKLQSQRCELIGETTRELSDPPGFERFVPSKAKSRALLSEVRKLKTECQELEARRKKLPERISAGDLKRLRTERQLLATLFKTVAYQVETELLRMVAPFYARAEDEGRKLIAAALRSPADLKVTQHEVRLTLAPQSSPHRSKAVAGLCASLNKLGACYPGTNLRLVLDCSVQSPTDVS